MQLAAGQLDNDLLRLDQAALLLVLTFLLATCTQSVEGPPATAAWRQLEDLGEPWQQLGRAKRLLHLRGIGCTRRLRAAVTDDPQYQEYLRYLAASKDTSHTGQQPAAAAVGTPPTAASQPGGPAQQQLPAAAAAAVAATGQVAAAPAVQATAGSQQQQQQAAPAGSASSQEEQFQQFQEFQQFQQFQQFQAWQAAQKQSQYQQYQQQQYMPVQAAGSAPLVIPPASASAGPSLVPAVSAGAPASAGSSLVPAAAAGAPASAWPQGQQPQPPPSSTSNLLGGASAGGITIVTYTPVSVVNPINVDNGYKGFSGTKALGRR